MKRKFILVAVGVALTSLLSIPSSAATITFDSLATASDPGIFVTDGYSFSGVDYISSGGIAFCDPACPQNGTNYLLEEDRYTVGWTMSQIGGGTFSLISFDGAEAHQGLPSYWAESIQVTGTLSGGGTVSESFQLDFIQDGDGPTVDFQRFNLSNAFTNLISVFFVGVGADRNWFSVDNIEVGSSNSIPEPSNIALMGLGLAGLALFRRRRG